MSFFGACCCVVDDEAKGVVVGGVKSKLNKSSCAEDGAAGRVAVAGAGAALGGTNVLAESKVRCGFRAEALVPPAADEAVAVTGEVTGLTGDGCWATAAGVDASASYWW